MIRVEYWNVLDPFVGTVHWGGIQHFDSCVPGDYGLLHSTSFHLNSVKKMMDLTCHLEFSLFT